MDPGAKRGVDDKRQLLQQSWHGQVKSAWFGRNTALICGAVGEKTVGRQRNADD